MRLIDMGQGIRINGYHWEPRLESLLLAHSHRLLNGLRDLHHRFEGDRQNFLIERSERAALFDKGDFSSLRPKSLKGAHGKDWKVGPSSRARTRRCEFLLPAGDRQVWGSLLQAKTLPTGIIFDFEDSLRPTWQNLIQGHLALGENLQDLIETLPKSQIPAIGIRPRGLHLKEVNVTVDGAPLCATLFDLGCALATLAPFISQIGPLNIYIPKLEDEQEARWFSQVLEVLGKTFDLPPGNLRCAPIIETVTAAQRMEEILFELKSSADALVLGRWDYIFSAIKMYRNHPDHLFLPRNELNLKKCSWLENFAKRLVQTAHRHGALSIGAMATEERSEQEYLRQEQVEAVYQAKHQEARLGLDGAWVADPYFISAVLEAFPLNHSLDQTWSSISEEAPLLPSPGKIEITEEDLLANIKVVLAYQRGFQKGKGRIVEENRVEDLCTFEISRTQLWHWLKHRVSLKGGGRLDRLKLAELFEREFSHQKELLLKDPGQHLEIAKTLNELRKALINAREWVIQEDLIDFLELAEDPQRAFPLD